MISFGIIVTRVRLRIILLENMIKWYPKGKNWIFNLDDVREPYDEQTLRRYSKPVVFPGG